MKLMLRRIDWAQENEDRRGRRADGAEVEEDEEEAAEPEEGGREPNRCDMVRGNVGHFSIPLRLSLHGRRAGVAGRGQGPRVQEVQRRGHP